MLTNVKPYHLLNEQLALIQTAYDDMRQTGDKVPIELKDKHLYQLLKADNTTRAKHIFRFLTGIRQHKINNFIEKKAKAAKGKQIET